MSCPLGCGPPVAQPLKEDPDMRPLSLLAVVSLASLAAAQTPTCTPVHFTFAERNSNNAFPFCNSLLPFRYIQIDAEIGVAPRILDRLSLRREGTGISAMDYGAYSITLSFWLSRAATTPATPSPAFDSNHGFDKTQVITNRTFNF